jgi:hypothetical protein
MRDASMRACSRLPASRVIRLGAQPELLTGAALVRTLEGD